MSVKVEMKVFVIIYKVYESNFEIRNLNMEKEREFEIISEKVN
jgi:hypothetical protein